MHWPLWWIARVTQGHLVCISIHRVSDSYFITCRHISGRFLISFFPPFSKAPRRPLAFATCIGSKVALFLNATVSGSYSKCCWINKINDSILPAVLYGFKKKTTQNFSCFYWMHSTKGRLKKFWYLPHILKLEGIICFQLCFGFFFSFYRGSYSDSLHETIWEATRSYSWGKCSSKLPCNLLEEVGFSDLQWSPLASPTLKGSRLNVDAL